MCWITENVCPCSTGLWNLYAFRLLILVAFSRYKWPPHWLGIWATLKKSETECAPWVSRRKPESPPRTFRAWFFPRFSIFILLPKICSRIRRQSPGKEVMDGMVWEITLHDPPQTVSKGYIKKKKSNLIFWITTPWAFVMRELGLALFTPYGWKVTDSRDKPFSADIGCFIFSFSFIFCNRQGSFQTPRREMGHQQVCISLPVLV